MRIETIGAGQFLRDAHGGRANETVMRLAVRHSSRKALELVSREWGCAGTSFAQVTQTQTQTAVDLN